VGRRARRPTPVLRQRGTGALGDRPKTSSWVGSDARKTAGRYVTSAPCRGRQKPARQCVPEGFAMAPRPAIDRQISRSVTYAAPALPAAARRPSDVPTLHARFDPRHESRVALLVLAPYSSSGCDPAKIEEEGGHRLATKQERQVAGTLR